MVKILAIYGTKQKTVDVPEACNGDTEGVSDNEWTVDTLKSELQQLFDVPACTQRIIFKGKTLQDGGAQLSSLKLKDGDKFLMLSSSKPQEAVVADGILKSLCAIEGTSVKHIQDGLEDLRSQIDGIEKGFLAPDLVPAAVSKITKKLKHINEDCMQTMLKLDRIEFEDNSGTDTRSSAQSAARTKRKSLVNAVHELLRFHDELEERTNQLLPQQN